MSRRRIYLLFLALITAVIFFGCGRKPGEKLYDEALTEWEAGHLIRARTLLEKSIRRRAGSPKNADAYNRLGLLLWETGDLKDAVSAFNESCRIDAGQFDVLCNLGVALSAQHDLTGAEHAFREASLLRPDESRPLTYAGIVYLLNQKWDSADHNLRRALQRHPSDLRLQNALALAELHTGHTENAAQRLQAIIQQNPEYTPALFNLAVIDSDWLKNPEDAKRLFHQYLDRNPSGPFAESAHVRLQTLDRNNNTLAFNPPRTPNRNNAEISFQKALNYHKKENFDSAAKWYIKTIEQDDTYEQAFYNLGLVYYSKGQMELAADAFAKAVRINPAFYTARYNNALALHWLEKDKAALRELEIVLSQQPDYQPGIDLMKRLKKE